MELPRILTERVVAKLGGHQENLDDLIRVWPYVAELCDIVDRQLSDQDEPANVFTALTPKME